MLHFQTFIVLSLLHESKVTSNLTKTNKKTALTQDIL